MDLGALKELIIGAIILFAFLMIFFFFYREQTKSWGMSQRKAEEETFMTVPVSVRMILRVVLFIVAFLVIIASSYAGTILARYLGEYFRLSEQIVPFVFLGLILVPMIFSLALIWMALRVR